MLFYRKPTFLTLPCQVHPLLRRGLGRPHPPFPLFLFTTIQNGNFITLCRSSLRNRLFHAWGTTSSVVLFNTKPSSQTLPRQAHPLLRRGLGRPSFSLFFVSEGLGEAAPSFFKYFRPLPHSLANIENMSTFFSIKIPLFCLSLQLLLLQSTNSLLFICFLLYPLILSSSLSSVVSSFPISPDRHVFQCMYNNVNIYKRINLFTFLWFYFLYYLSLSIKMYIIKNMINYLCCYIYAWKHISINI